MKRHLAIVHMDMHAQTRGGINVVYQSLIERLARNFQVTLITQQTESPLTIPGGRVIALPRTEDLAFHRRVVDATLTAIAPDIVECSTWAAECLLYAQRPAQTRAPVLVRADLSAHTMGIPDYAAAERLLLEHADKIIAVGTWTADDIEQAYGIRPQIVPNGVDRTQFSPGPANALLTSGQLVTGGFDSKGKAVCSQDLTPQIANTERLWERITTPDQSPVRVMWLGKLTEMKGFDRFQEAVRALRGQAVFTVVVGHGVSHYDFTIADEPHVQFLQDLNADDLVSLYRSAHYKLTTSRWEGFGLADAEALACGIPVLMPADLGTTRELLTDGVTGAVWTDVDHLVSILNAQPRLTGALPAEFDWDANAATTTELYTQLLTARKDQR
ncbi:glycosyltransferase family 4 protein [Streptomyces californicus]|uniref:glycosyltransferase family 4 protein n=1 Tax=Streptomyces californicus TaxID=67351 RepID=UPI0037A3479B